MQRDSSQALIEQQEAAITELERDGILHIVCPICNLYFPDTTSGRATRNKHIHQIHNTQKNTTQSNKLPTLPKEHQFQCPHCLETRSSWYEFDLHKKQHELIKCCVCGKTMTSEGGLQLHFRKFHAVNITGPRADGGPLGKYKRYKCPLETCEFYTTYVPTFKDTAILMSHFEGAHPEKCKFWHDDELVDGTEDEASGEEDSDGDDEDEGDLEGEDDDVEDELHDEDDGQTTVSDFNFNSEENNDLYRCAICPTKFRSLEQLRKHSKGHAPQHKSPIHCSYCPKKFHTAERLEIHIRSCANKVPPD